MSVTTLNVAPGFHSDVCKLLESFSQASEIRMHEFTKIWRKMEFLKIFMYREGRELIMFTEECFRILLRLIMSDHPVQFRVGAFFCLYSVYVAQPLKSKVKIRLVPETWKCFQNLLEESQLEPWENEIKFAFWTLAYKNAFLYVAKSNSTGLVITTSEGDGLLTSNFSQVMEDYMSSDHQILKEVHARYMNLKDSLPSCSANTIQMVEKHLLSFVEKDVEALQKKFHISSNLPKQQNVETESEYELSEDSEDSEAEDTLERRRKVRLKQQSLHVQQSKSRRHRATDAPVASARTNKKARGRPRKSTQGNERPFQDVEMNATD